MANENRPKTELATNEDRFIRELDCPKQRGCSSVRSEHQSDVLGVIGSNPINLINNEKDVKQNETRS